VIVVKDLRFRYPGRQEDAICGMDFAVEEGEVFGFLGPSGAGKTTTQKIVLGVLKDYDGSVQIRGRESRSAGPFLYEDIGVSFEMPTLYSKLTARENLRFFASLYRGPTVDPVELLAMVGLEEDADNRVSGFSKGMKMRLNLCRALLNRPDLVFLDEPTTGQDPVNSRRIRDIICGLGRQGRTVFLNTHDMKVAEEVCDRVAFVVDGRIALVDAPRRLQLERGRRSLRVEYGGNGMTSSRDFVLEGIGTNTEFLSLIRDHEVQTMHTMEASLEDVFIQVTGRALS
jgi:fluoroquinolone transport system ATP-binding protein